MFVRSKKSKKKGTKKKKVVRVAIKVKAKKKASKKGSVGLVVTSRKKAPVAKASSYRQKGPKINSGRGFVVRNKEFLISLSSGGTTFEAFTFPNAPGVATTFPWLSQIAVGFKEYRFRRLRYQYEPNCPTSYPGALVMLPIYNVDDLPPTSIQQALDMKGAINVPVWQRSYTDFKDQKFLKNLMVRTSNLPGSDPSYLLYDFGKMCFIFDNLPVTPNFGKIFVEYEIEFFIPVRLSGISSGFGGIWEMKHESGLSTSPDELFEHVENAARIFPPMSSGDPYLQLGASDNATLQDTIKFAIPGVYAISICTRYATSTVNTSPISNIIVAGCQLVSLYNSVIVTGPAPVNTRQSYSFVIRSYLPEATSRIVFLDGDTNTLDEVLVSIVTIPNSLILLNNEFSSVLQVMSESNMDELLKRKLAPPSYFDEGSRVLKDNEFKEFLVSGVMPKMAPRVVAEHIARLQKQLSLLAIETKREESDEDKDDDFKVPDRKSVV